ncbi:MAG: EAL domain-containing protein [Rhodoferax sp.]|uniref:bifunctional diguanylate cyclase/phosphodiesterase n=1 Tax=Rhodoferax sp. TaxID=50421 RepID=UPI001400AD75|nr:EAL domain-containing protein [Rhodoferax sp.]NDP37130.1 EAL domain-containing protein [Rhodoferax sp.]
MMHATHQNRTRQWLVATVVFFFSAVAAVFLIWRWEQQTLVEARAHAADMASDHAQTLQRDIERSLSATYAIAALVRQGQGDVRDFEAVATEMLPFYPGIAALGLSPGGVIRSVVPLAGNEKSIGFDQLKDVAQNKEAIKARDTGRLTLAGPLKLAQGGMGIVGRLPVFLTNEAGQKTFWGFTNVTLRFPEALASARLPLLTQRGYSYELWRTLPDTGERQNIEASGTTALESPVERTLELPNGQWTLSVTPIGGWGQSGSRGLTIAAGLMVSLLMAYLAWLLYEMRMRDQGLEVQVNERTAEILATQRQLQATLGAIPDPLFELGLNGHCYDAHSSRTQLLAWPVDDLIGQTVTQVLPPEACQVVLAALQEANDSDCSIGKQIKLPLDNGMHWFELSVARKSALPGEEPRFLVLCRDITESKQAERKIRLLAHFDSLTGLPNRVLLTDRCGLALHAAQRNDTPLALMFLDLDHFKHVNDSLGHQVGDALLTMMAGRLKGAVREQDTVSRLGGDEFILVLPDTDAVGAAHIAEKLLESALVAFEIAPHELTVTPSIGIALFPSDGSDFDTLSRCADAAMYRAKQDGRNNYRFFTTEMQTRSERTLALENALRRALERNQLSLHYQPQVSLATGNIIGAEALLRWNHPDLGAVSPVEFIPVAESCGLILPIGEWVLRTAVQQFKTWLEAGMAPITISVNLSSVQFRHADLPELVSTILDEARLPAHFLELELTEGVAMTDPLGAISVMNDLHERGVRMSIDDFGTGYSSLSYLKKFRIYKVKIDQSFVRDITEDADDKAIVGAIISMATSLGMQTIAEGVETEGQLEFLKAKGCTEVQGYYFSRPLPVEQFEAFMQTRSPSNLAFVPGASDVDIRL